MVDTFCITERLSEFIGTIIGDGNIRDRHPYYVELTGNPLLEVHYYTEILVPLVLSELSYNPKIYFHSGGIRMRINNKCFVMFLKSIGIPAGAGKFKNVNIPREIANNPQFCKACLRGIFDTDGGVHYDKRKIYVKPYIRIELHMLNRPLLSQINSFLANQGIASKLPKNRNSVYINGYNNVKRYIDIIGFNNKRNIDKISKYFPELTKVKASEGN